MLNLVLGRRMLLGFGTVLVVTAIVGIYLNMTLSDLAQEIKAGRMSPETIATALHEIHLSAVGFIGLILVLGIGMAFFTTHGINKTLRGIYGAMDKAAGQMDGTSYEILLSSNSLADAASKQALAMEQTSSYLQKMTAMTRTFAKNTSRTDHLIEETNEVIRETSASVGLLIESMKVMTETALESHGIITDIGEIASHTSLVAINAGMEAARGGQGALGFSVIVEELRSLASRSATAAKRTGNLIENTIQKAQASSAIAAQTAKAFTEIAGGTAQVRQYVAEIAAASSEQAWGIEQTHSALTEINRATEQTSASARGTSTASQGLSSQSAAIRESLGNLIAFTYGNKLISRETLGSLRTDLRSLASRADLKAPDPGVHRKILKEWLQRHSRWVEAIYTNTADGAFVFSEPPAAIPNACIRPWWQKAMQGAEYISPAYVSAITKKPCCTISLPLLKAQGEVAGVMGADIRLR